VSLAGLFLSGDEDGGVTLHCEHEAHPWDGGRGIAYIGYDTHGATPDWPTFGVRDVDGFFAFAQQHVASHASAGQRGAS
jgi:hypothetical protein